MHKVFVMKKTKINPALSYLIISLSAFLLGVLGLYYSMLHSTAAGPETTTVGIISLLSMIAALIGFIAAIIFWRMWKSILAIKHGVNEIARWQINATELDEFRVADSARSALGNEYSNDYHVPATSPNDGTEIIFAEDGVLIGEFHFPLVTTGNYSFSGVQMLTHNPRCIEFGINSVSVSHGNAAMRTDALRSTLRVPVPAYAASKAAVILSHFLSVDAREIIVNAARFTRLIRFGLISAPLLLGVAAIGYWLDATGLKGNIPLIMIISGIILGMGALFLAFAAWVMHKKQLG